MVASLCKQSFKFGLIVQITSNTFSMVFNCTCTLHATVVSNILPYSLRLGTLIQVVKRRGRQLNLGRLPRFKLDL